MPVITYEDVIPTLIINTSMQIFSSDGVQRRYTITPNDGYVLHDKGYDEEVLDPETMEPTGEVILGYRTSTASCNMNYDFTVNPNEYYAVLRSEVPESQIFGDTTPDHEIM